MINKQDISKLVNEYKDTAIVTAKKIWDKPELAYNELFASNLLKQELIKSKFKIINIKGMPTAFRAEFSYNKNPKINFGILGEYDALSGAGIKKHSGHGCGHNLLGAGSMLAAIVLSKIIKRNKLNFGISYFGCPAEENGAGKVQMIKKGIFENIDFCITWHPAAKNSITNDIWIGSKIITVNFYGNESHSSMNHISKNVNDIMCKFIHKFKKIKAKNISYVINNSNQKIEMNPKLISIDIAIREFENKKIIKIFKKIKKIAMSISKENIKVIEKEFYPITKHDLKLQDYINNNLMKFQSELRHSNKDVLLANKILKDIPKIIKKQNILSMNIPLDWANDVFNKNILYSKKIQYLNVPTDVGAVSQIIPTIQFQTICFPIGIGLHTKQATLFSNSQIGFKGMIYAAKIIVGSILDIAESIPKY